MVLSTTILTDFSLRTALSGLAISLPLLLLFWLVRRAYYIETQPLMAASNSALYAGTALTGLFVLWRLGYLSVLSGFMLLAIASMIASLHWLVRLYSARKRLSMEPLPFLLEKHWMYGRWAVLTAVLSLGTTQIQIFLIAALGGLDSAGALRALLNFILPMAQVLVAIGTLILPRFALSYYQMSFKALRRNVVYLTLTLTIASILYELGLLTLGSTLERVFYNGKLAALTYTVPILGLVLVFSAISTGYSLALRAVQRPDLVTLTSIITLVFCGSSSTILILLMGITGAAISFALTYGVSALTTWYFYRRALRIIDAGN
jgi:O-antigen/teichoic acid export membrane protein